MTFANLVLHAASECIFCQIASGTRPADLVFESRSTVAFLDRCPAARGHTLVVPRQHAPTLLELEDGAAGALFGAVVEVMEILAARLEPVGFNVGWNHGAAAGQHVFHLHVHVLPRFRAGGSGIQAVGEGADGRDLARLAPLLRPACREPRLHPRTQRSLASTASAARSPLAAEVATPNPG